MDLNFISAGAEYNTRKKNVHAPLFRKLFEIKKSVTHAELIISAVGFYRAFFNGKEITKGYLAPYISNPDDVVYYDRYDVTDLIRKQNVFCAVLGNGFGNALDCGIWDFDKAPFRAAPKLGFKLISDGECAIESDESLEVFDSPITFDDIRFGEKFDARSMRMELLDYTKVEGGRKAISVVPPKGDLRECTAQPIKAFEEIQPVGIMPYEGGYIYDFGQNNAGVYRLNINGKRGQTVKLMFFELMRDGKPHRDEFTFAYRNDIDYDIQRDEYICVDGEQSYVPSFTYHGYRYVYVEGITQEQATDRLLTYIVLHADFPVVGEFSCDDKIINKVEELTVRSDLSNFYYFPTDCPHREKNGWTGDAVCGAEQLLYHFDCVPSLTEWLYNIVKTQRADGALPGIVPTGGWGYEWGNGPAWDAVIVELPYRIYKMTGDLTAATISAHAIERYFEYAATRKNTDGLFAYGLGDWCEIGGKITTPLEVTDTLTLVDMTAKAGELFDALGNTTAAQRSRAFHDGIVGDFRKKYVSGGRLTVKTQTALAMSVVYGVFMPDEIDPAYSDLKAAMDAADGKMQIGVLGAKVLFDALTAAGMADMAFDAVRGPYYPSYGYLVEQGATTLWESFVDMSKEKLSYDSFNHYFWGSVSAWFFRSIAGLNVTSHDTVKIAPHPIDRLNGARACYKNGARRISVEWRRDGHNLTVKVDNYGYSGKIKIDGYSAVGNKNPILTVGHNEFTFVPSSDC